jgi:phosphoribosylformylglycinamidine (FGAM) synthase-like enzyme
VKQLLLFAVLLTLPLSGCQTSTGDPVKDARGRATNQALLEAGKVLGRVAVSALFNAATQEATGETPKFQQAAAGALWANVDAASTSAAISRIVDAYAGGKAPATAEAAAKAAGSNVTPAKVNAIASVISSATGAPPAPREKPIRDPRDPGYGGNPANKPIL